MPSFIEGVRTHKIALIIVGLFFVLGFVRLNDVSIYTPDSALYLIWGNAVAHGHGFVDYTKPEPDRYIINAPFYAVLLAPAEWLAPMSLTAAKTYTLLWGCVALYLMYLFLLRYFGRWSALAGMVMLGFNPMVLVFSTEVLSEAPFLVFLLSMLLLVERFLSSGKAAGEVWAFVLLVLLAGSVVILREVGWALVLGAGFGLILSRNYRPALGVLAAGAIVFGVWYLRNNIWVGVPSGGRAGNFSLIFQHFMTGPDDSMLSEFAARARQNMQSYMMQFGGALFYSMFSNAQLNLVVDPSWLFRFFTRFYEVSRYFIILIASIMMVLGLVNDLWSQWRSAVVRLLFIVLLLAIVAVYPVYDIRFLLPLLPLMVFYLISGIHWIVGGVFRRGWNEFAVFVLALLLMVPNMSAVADILRTNVKYRLDPAAFSAGNESVPVVFTWPWTAMGDWITRNTDKDALIATPVKDIARTVGERKVLELEPNIVLPQFENVMRDYRVHYLLAAVRWGDLRTYEFLMQESKRFAFQHVHSEGTLHLYKVTSRLLESVNQADPFAEHADTVTVSGITRTARSEIRNERYASALRWLRKARALEPNMEEPVFQTVVAAVLAGDSATAHAAYRDLLALPQTLSLSLMGSQLLQVLELQQSAAHTAPDRRSLQMLDASLLLWNNGYPSRARDILGPILEERTDFFAGMLWGFHYNLQLGDTGRAMLYLGRLQAIDPKNPPVHAFTVIGQLMDSLRTAGAPSARARLHTAIAVQYRAIELPDVAMDEAERALHEDPHYAPAMMLTGSMLESRARLGTAAYWYAQAAKADPKYGAAESRARLLDSLSANGLTLNTEPKRP